MAFGAVPAGIMKARLADIEAQNTSTSGGRPVATDTAPTTGRNAASVATFDMNSEANTVSAASSNSTRIGGSVRMPDSASPSQPLTPCASIAAATLRPPPNSRATPQGMRSAVVQSSSRRDGTAASPDGIANSTSAPAMAITVSLRPESASIFFSSGANIHASATSAKTTSTRRSGVVIGPSARRRAASMHATSGFAACPRSGRDSSHQQASSITSMSGSAMIIHCANPRSRPSLRR